MPNYDVIEDKGSYLGTRITSPVPSKAYKDGWDRIFGNKQESKEPETKQDPKLLQK